METKAHFDLIVGDTEGEFGVGTVLENDLLFVDCCYDFAEGEEGKISYVFGGSSTRGGLKRS